MLRTWYERLSMLDNVFLAFEGPTTFMHIGAVAIFEPGPLATPDGGVDGDRIRAHVAARLPSIPRYRQRLAYVPIDNHPVWVDDEHFDLRYHVRHTSVPRPGTDAQLRDLSARLLERPLSRARPLWEIWVVEGLEGGRFALVMKVHHCMVDGLAGAELLTAILSPVPDAAVEEPAPWHPRRAPSGTELLSAELRRRVAMSMDLWQRLRAVARAPRERTDVGRRVSAAWQLLRDGVRRPVATPINQRIGAYRRFDWVMHDLAEVKRVKNQLGGTVNDVVLTVVAGAVRGFFERRHFALNRLDFRAAVPVNVRTAEERSRIGNRVSAWIVPLPLRERDPARRLHAVGALSSRFKKTNQAMGAQVLTEAAEWTSANVLSLGALVANQTQPFNLIVTNVPGPQFPLYLLGAPMVAIFPLVPLFKNQCLGVALFSYAGKLFWGFNADFDALPDLDRFVAAIERAFRDLRKAAQPDVRKVPAKPRSRVRRVAQSIKPTGQRAQRVLNGEF